MKFERTIRLDSTKGPYAVDSCLRRLLPVRTQPCHSCLREETLGGAGNEPASPTMSKKKPHLWRSGGPDEPSVFRSTKRAALEHAQTPRAQPPELPSRPARLQPHLLGPSKGKLYTCYRRDGQRSPIGGEPGSAEWFRSYAAIHESSARPGRGRPADGTLAALIEAYKASLAYKQFAKKTRKDYDRNTEHLSAQYGQLAVATLPRAFVFKLRDKHAETPKTANYYVQVFRLLLSYAVDQGGRQDNPALWRDCRPVKQAGSNAGRAVWRKCSLAGTSLG